MGWWSPRARDCSQLSLKEWQKETAVLSNLVAMRVKKEDLRTNSDLRQAEEPNDY